MPRVQDGQLCLLFDQYDLGPLTDAICWGLCATEYNDMQEFDENDLTEYLRNAGCLKFLLEGDVQKLTTMVRDLEAARLSN